MGLPFTPHPDWPNTKNFAQTLRQTALKAADEKLKNRLEREEKERQALHTRTAPLLGVMRKEIEEAAANGLFSLKLSTIIDLNKIELNERKINDIRFKNEDIEYIWFELQRWGLKVQIVQDKIRVPCFTSFNEDPYEIRNCYKFEVSW